MNSYTNKVIATIDLGGLGNTENRNGFFAVCTTVSNSYPNLIYYPDELKLIADLWAVAQIAARNIGVMSSNIDLFIARDAILNADTQINSLVINYLNANPLTDSVGNILATAELRLAELEPRLLDLAKLGSAKSDNEKIEFDALSLEKQSLVKSRNLKNQFAEVAAIQAQKAMDQTVAVMNKIYPKKQYYFVKNRIVVSMKGEEVAFMKGEPIMAFEQNNGTVLLNKSGKNLEIPLFMLTRTVGGSALAIDPEEVELKRKEAEAEAERQRIEKERKEAEEKAERDRIRAEEKAERDRIREEDRLRDEKQAALMLAIVSSVNKPAPVAPAPVMSPVQYENAVIHQNLAAQLGMPAPPIQPTVSYIPPAQATPAPTVLPVPQQAVQTVPQTTNEVSKPADNKTGLFAGGAVVFVGLIIAAIIFFK